MNTTGVDRNRAFGGLLLILMGLLALLSQFVDMEWLGLLILPTLGVVFLAWGVVSRQSGLFIPGGILSGLGLGTLLMVGPWSDNFSGDQEPAVFLLAFALGWVLIPLFATIFTNEHHWWALIPAAIIGAVGVALLMGEMGLTVLKIFGYLWPLALVVLGLYIIFKRGSREDYEQPLEKPVEKFE